MQVIHGPPGLRPLEPVLQFVQRNHTHFPGGVYYVSALNNHFYEGAEEAVCRVRRSTIPYRAFPLVCLILLVGGGQGSNVWQRVCFEVDLSLCKKINQQFPFRGSQRPKSLAMLHAYLTFSYHADADLQVWFKN